MDLHFPSVCSCVASWTPRRVKVALTAIPELLVQVSGQARVGFLQRHLGVFGRIDKAHGEHHTGSVEQAIPEPIQLRC